jgi:hypothetical protein
MTTKTNSDIHLRPRFKMELNVNQDDLITKFKDNLNNEECKYCSKIVDGHIVIDVPKDENYFWSPQLNIEIEQYEIDKTIVKGLFGPKPQVWTLFMFFHFAVAVAFTGFSVLAYVQWSLKTEYINALTVVILLPIIWILMYFLGRLGKSTGNKQMDELYQFMMKTLEK